MHKGTGKIVRKPQAAAAYVSFHATDTAIAIALSFSMFRNNTVRIIVCLSLLAANVGALICVKFVEIPRKSGVKMIGSPDRNYGAATIIRTTKHLLGPADYAFEISMYDESTGRRIKSKIARVELIVPSEGSMHNLRRSMVEGDFTFWSPEGSSCSFFVGNSVVKMMTGNDSAKKPD